MTTDNLSEKTVRAAILDEAKQFITALNSGASNERLEAILVEMHEKELQLLKMGAMLDPEIWRVLRSRLASRGNTDIIDTTI